MASKTSAHRSKALRAKSPQIKTSRGKIARKKPPASKTTRAKSSREKVSDYRERMRAKGFRLVQMWLPDTRTLEFAALAHRDSLAIANSPTEQDDQAFVDSVSWLTSEENAE
jgi:antidote-toxin recognition MazE-like antitoxin